MNRDINALSPWAAVFAYGVLGIGWLSVVIFLVWYGFTRPWTQSEMGRHIFAFTAVVGAFFTLYLVIAIWPDMPEKLRMIIRLTLLLAIVTTCVWRLIIFAKQDARDRRAAKETGH